MPQSFSKEDASHLKPVPFPSGAPKPHELEKWYKWLHSATVNEKLNEVARRRDDCHLITVTATAPSRDLAR